LRGSFFRRPHHNAARQDGYTMKTKRKSMQKTPQKALALGFFLCLFSLLAVLFLSAMLILFTKDPLTNSDRFSPLAFAAAGALAGLVGRKCAIGKPFLLCPALLMLVGLLLGLFLSGGHIAPSALLSEGIYLGAAYLFFYLGGVQRKKKRRYH
jgi:hypothetical protein